MQVTVTADAQTRLSADGGATFASTLVLTLTDTQPQTITVGAVDDNVNEGRHTGVLAYAVASADSNYNALPIPPESNS